MKIHNLKYVGHSLKKGVLYSSAALSVVAVAGINDAYAAANSTPGFAITTAETDSQVIDQALSVNPSSVDGGGSIITVNEDAVVVQKASATLNVGNAGAPSNGTVDGAGGAAGGDGIQVDAAGTDFTVNVQTAGSIIKGIGAGNAAIRAGGTGLQVSNTGTIQTTGLTGIDINAASTRGISNSGIIQDTTTGTAIDVGANIDIENLSGGTIQTGGAGIAIKITGGTTSTVSNAGTLKTVAGGTTVDIDAAHSGITNAGTIEAAAGVAVQVGHNGNITNSGTIKTATGGAVIDFDGTPTATINNTGTIEATGSGGEAIDISVAVTGAISNSGTIKANDTDAILMGADLSAGITNFASGTITTGAGGAAAAIKVGAAQTGAITNSGTISTANGIAIDVDQNVAGGISNAGTITAVSGDAIEVVGGKNANITNSGTITTDTGAVIDITAAAGSTLNITNSGTISTTGANSTEGIFIGADLTGAISNTGTISTADSTALDLDGSISAHVSNSGTITATTGSAIDLANTKNSNITNIGGNITSNNGTATINLAGAHTSVISNSGVLSNTGAGAVIKAAGDITGSINNSGTISATSALAIDLNGKLTAGFVNSGTITTAGAVNGVDVGGKIEASGFINSGTISVADNQTAVIFSADADVVGDVANTGTLTAGGASGVAIDATAITTVGNAITVSNTGTITGDVKLGTQHAFQMNGGTLTGDLLAGAGDDTVTVTGGQITGKLDGGAGTDTLTFTMGSGNTYTTGGGVIDLFETVRVTSGTLVVSNTVTNATTFKVDSGAAATLTAGVGATTFDNDGTVRLDGNQTVTGNYDQAAAGVLQIGITNATTAGELDVTGTTDLNDSKIEPILIGNAFIANGTTFTVVDSAGALSNGTVTVVDNNNSAVLSFSASKVANDIILTANRTTFNSIVDSNTGTASGSAAAVALEAAAASASGDMQTVIETLNGFSAAKITETIDQMAPKVDGGAQAGSVAASSGAINTISSRLASLRDSGGESGLAAGHHETAANNGVWLQGFGADAGQGTRKGVEGFDANSLGVAIGADYPYSDKLRLGVALSYASTDVTSRDNTRSSTDVDSYQGTIYGDYDFADDWYAEGMVGFAFNSYKGKRNITNLNRVASSDYDGSQVTARVGAGYEWNYEGLEIEPSGSLLFSRVGQDSYNETGAGASNLTGVDPDDVNTFKAGLGVNLSYGWDVGHHTTIEPEVRVNYSYDLSNERPSITSSFSGGGGAFTSIGAEPARSTFNLGTGVEVLSRDMLSLRADYDYEFKPDFQSHTGSFKVRYEF